MEWAVCVIQGMYSNAYSHVQVNVQYSEDFGMGVGVSFLSPLLFILVVEALSCEFCTGVPWELLYTDDLVLIVDSQEECISKLKAWKAGIESKGLHVNMNKTKCLVSGVGHDVLQKSDKCPWAVCCSGVGRNPIMCWQCMLWVHKMCSGNSKWPVEDPNYICPSMAELWMTWILTSPCLMWKTRSATSVICCAPVGRWGSAIAARCCVPWGKFRKLLPVLTTRHLSPRIHS